MRVWQSSTKRAKWGLAVGLAVMGAAVAAPSPALADRSECSSGHLCLWDGPTYGSGRADYNLNGWVNTSGFNDIASSAYNNTNRWAMIASDPNGGGYLVACLAPGGFTSFNTGGFPPIDNVASSVWLGTSNPGC